MEKIANQLRDKGDVIIAFSVVFVILIMLIPLNPFLADMFLTVSISVSLLILFIGMYIRRPLDFSVFPSVLLITTLFRLSLNIASTRLILLHGDEGPQAAGKLIKAFGTFIVGGNYVVGCVVFLILIIINFVVITKGAGRVAEVAARFTLDAMPGKQMSIDADLNAGLIDDVAARKRRQNVEIEADFYGAMDGASKFVRGDAIAGIIIVFVNILGGFAIGVLQKGMNVTEALSRLYHPDHRGGPCQPDTGPAHLNGSRHHRHQGRQRIEPGQRCGHPDLYAAESDSARLSHHTLHRHSAGHAAYAFYGTVDRDFCRQLRDQQGKERGRGGCPGTASLRRKRRKRRSSPSRSWSWRSATPSSPSWTPSRAESCWIR